MHKSCLAGFVIDCRTLDLDEATEFWSRALGWTVLPEDQTSPSYRQLDTGQEGLHVEVQQVSHNSRVHLDIETDDIEAEVERLEGLGAKQVEKVRTWCVMEAPTGQRFCVVRVQGPGFERRARGWD